MNVANIISLTRDQTGWTTTSQISDAQMLIYLNTVYHEIFSDIAETDKKLAWQQWTAPTVAGQHEYTFPKLNTSTSKPGMKRMINVYIKYKSTDDNYTKIKSMDYETFAASSDYLAEYENYKASGDGTGLWNIFPYPFMVRADEFSFFLNPVTNESVSDWLKIQWLYTPLDLTLTDSETDIKLQREYHNLIALWMEQYVWGYRQIDSKRNIAMNRFAVMKQNMIRQQHNMPEGASHDSLPSLSHFE